MRTSRQELFKAIYDDLSAQNTERIVLAAQQINSQASEGVMQEEARALPAFFKPEENGIYNLLLKKHPKFKTPGQAKAAEDAAIKELVSEIETRLALAEDRLNRNKPVGIEAARAAVANSNKRWRREYPLGNGSGRTFDEIGQLHTALRLILNDKTIKHGSTWSTQYFDGLSGFDGGHKQGKQTYRHYLALIWKGATEDNIEAPITYAGLSSQELKKSAITQIISTLAQCRREHNFDGRNPDWDQATKPQDAQRCDMGLRGDLFGQMLIHNEHYMQTRTKLNVELLEPLIKDAIVKEFKKLDTATKIKIIGYIESKSLVITDPSDEEQSAMDEFIRTTKLTVASIVQQDISKVDSDSPLYNIKKYMDNMTRKANSGDTEAKNAVVRVLDNIQSLVSLEADSLNLNDHTNTANLDFLRRFISDGVSQVYQERLAAGLKNDVNAQRQLINQHLEQFKKIEGLGYLIENDLMRATFFTEAPLSAEKKLRYEQIIQQYEQPLDIMETQIAQMIQQYANRTEVDQQFAFVGEEGVKANLDRQQRAFIDSQGAILEQISKMRQHLIILKAQLSTPEKINTLNVRTHLKNVFTLYPATNPSPDFYAQYLWALLREKTPAGHYLDDDNKELTKVLDLIFGNEEKGIQGLDSRQKSLIMFAFNSERQTTIASEHARWDIVNKYLAQKGISLGTGLNVPSNNLITIADAAYQASKISTTTWQTIINNSGQKAELEQSIGGVTFKTPQDLITAAIKLPLSLYSTAEKPLDKSKQEKALSTWNAVAQSINDADPSGALLINFVTETLMANLGITQFSREDHKVIQQIVKTYAGIQEYERHKFPLPFMPQTAKAQRFAALGNHLSLMLTTLSAPSIKSSFEAGFVRLMSRDDAQDKVGNSHYILRLSNLQPNKLTVTFAGTSVYENKYLSSKDTQQISIGNKSFEIGEYQGTELNDKVVLQVANKSSIVPDLTLEKMTQKTHQAKRHAAFTEAASNYHPIGWHNNNRVGFSDVRVDDAQGHREAIKNVKAVLGELDEPKAVDSKPKAVDSKPKAVDSKPKAVDSKPKAVDPKPKAVDPKPKAVDPKPLVVETPSLVTAPVQPNRNGFFAPPKLKTTQSENQLMIIKLTRLTQTYQHDLNASNPLQSSIAPILKQLLNELTKANTSDADKIINFYKVLDEKKTPQSLRNLDVIAQDKSRSGLKFLAGVVSCVLIVASLGLLGVVAYTCGFNPLDLLKTQGSRYTDQLNAIKSQAFPDDTTEARKTPGM